MDQAVRLTLNATLNEYSRNYQRIELLQAGLALDVEHCWFKFKVHHFMSSELMAVGHYHNAVEHQIASFSNALHVYNQGGHSTEIVITPALALVNLYHTSGGGRRQILRNIDEVWQVVNSVSEQDRSLRIRAATHVPWMLANVDEGTFVYKELIKKMIILASDPSKDCLNLQDGQCDTAPQNYSHWYPTFALHYHNFNSRENLRLTSAISSLYLKSTRSLSWVSPALQSTSTVENDTVHSYCRAPPDNKNNNNNNNNSKQSSRIKLALVSAFFSYDHSLGQHIRGVIDTLNRNKFQVILIHLGDRHPELDRTSGGDILISNNINDDMDIFLDHANFSILANHRTYISALNLDILIYPEIGMDAHACRLFLLYPGTQILRYSGT